MKTVFTFTMTEGSASVALPTRFLDPIGRMATLSQNTFFVHKDQNDVLQSRSYTESSGTLGSNPFTTVSGSSLVTVAHTAHGFNAGGSVYYSGLSGTVGGLTLDGSFEVRSITTNAYVIETRNKATSSTSGGGSAVAYTMQDLNEDSPGIWAVWDERIQFEAAFNEQQTCQLQHFQSLPLLSATNETNFLTDRYPHLLRTACTAAAADFEQDNEEYNRLIGRLKELVGAVAIENDGMYRGGEYETWTPGGR